MKAMVLCAGYGTRLGPLTEKTPKPMLPLHGIPLLEYILRQLAAHGFDQIVINVHAMADSFEKYFKDGSMLGIQLIYSHEPNLLGTAGGVKKVEEIFKNDESFLIHYGDLLTNQNLSDILNFHQKKDALATLLLHKRIGSNSAVALDDDQRITAFLERPTPEERRTLVSPWVNSGICVVKSKFLKEIPHSVPCDLARDIFPKLVSRGSLYGFPLTGFRHAIDSPERFSMANKIVSEKGRELFPWLGDHEQKVFS